ncbi:hypothetical protein [Roseibium sp. LAB1]
MQLVFNLSARHAVSFLDVQSGLPGRGRYLNRAAVTHLAGKPLTGTTVRERVDRVVTRVAASVGRSVATTDIHFGAAELNSSGIAYFGDVCLVLKSDKVPGGLLSLLRNSYDLTVAPVFAQIYVNGNRSKTEDNAVRVMTEWAGTWPDETGDLVVVKILQYAPPSERRLTTGLISTGVLQDEDFIEVVYEKSFTPKEVREIRLSPMDVAREAQIADRTMRGPSPSAADMLWRYRRRQVERDAKRVGLTCRVVTHSGRSRA